MSISDVAVLVERSLQQVNDCIWPSGYYDPYLWIAIVGGLAMCWMGFGIGANDVANQFGSSVGSGAIVLWAAVVLALIFEFLGAVLLGGTVADAVRSGILDLDSLSDAPAVVMYANMCALIGAALWLQLASRYGLPVSTTHSIVGALIGVGVAAGQPGAVKWKKVGGIVLSWIASPLLSACLSSLIFVITRTGILRRRDPVKVGLRLLWLLVFVVTIVFTLFFVFKNSWVIGGMTCVKPDGSIEDPCSVQKWAEYNIGLAVVTSFGVAALLTLIFSPVAYWYSFRVLKKYDADGGMKFNQSQIGATETGGCSPVDVENGTGVQMQSNEAPNGTDTPTSDSQKARSLASVETAALDPRLGSPQWFKSKWDSAPWFRDLHGEAIAEDPFARELKQKTEKFDPRVERFFCTCQIISASFGCVAHGANDVANAVAPFATVLGIYHTCYVNEDNPIPVFVLAIGGVCIAMGLALYGYNVIKTMGCKMVEITPSRGYAIELGSASTVVIFSQFGIPLSTTHCQVGATVGVGLMERRGQDPFEAKWSNCGLFNWSGVNWKLMGKVFTSWVLTLVCSAGVTMILFASGVYGPSIWDDNYGGGGRSVTPPTLSTPTP